MNKKGMIIFNIVVIIIMLFELYLFTTKNEIKLQTDDTFSRLADSSYKFDLRANPNYTLAKAGERLNITLRLKNINMGETGLNTIQGYLRYDEDVFDEFTVEGTNNWVIEQNKYKDHTMYGKFVLYTMQEGITEDQNVVNITLKLKDDLKPQTTEIDFYDLKTSEGSVSVESLDAVAKIEIYEEKKTENEVAPVEPEPEKTEEEKKTNEIDTGKVVEEVIPQDDGKEEKPVIQKTNNVKTGDNIYIWFAVAIISLVAFDVIVIIKNKKDGNAKGTKVVTIASIILLALILVAITSIANNTIIKELVTSLSYKEAWLNSSTYLVTDTEVSRIAPNTDASEILDKFNKEIKLYSEKTAEEKAITSGLVATGMKITDYEETYGVSVLGDINGDGESDHIDLTKIIRNIVNRGIWTLSGEKLISADINIDKEIDEADRNLEIKYILYGEMDIPAFEQVEAPKIEVVEGTYFDEIEAYETEVKVKITNDDTNVVKTMYKIDGQISQQYQEISKNQEITLDTNGVYKISAYSYGKDGNRSEIEYEIVVKKNPNKDYKVITYTKVQDEYTSEEETRTGRIGTIVEANVTAPEGYLIENDKSTLSGKIEEDEDLVLEVYMRPGYIVTYKPGVHGTFEEQIKENIDFGATTPSFTGELTCDKGYEFAGWDKEIAETVTKNEVYTATWRPIEYTIGYELDGGTLGVDQNNIPKTNPLTYTVETPTFTLNNPTKAEYAFLGWTGTGLLDETEEVTITKGSTGNRNYTANWERATGITYNVEYYLENITKNEYTLYETVERNGNLNQNVTAHVKTYAGFTFDEENTNNVLNGTILNSGELVLKVYYKRNEYTFKLIAGEGIENVKFNTETPAEEVEKTVRYEQVVNIDATVKTEAGYTLNFDKWSSSDTELLADIETKEAQVTIPLGDLELTASATKEARNVNYTVEYYYQEEGQYPTSVSGNNKVTRTGKTGTTAEVTDADKVPIAGYVYDEDAENVESAEILADETTTLKLYFKEQFTVTYKPGAYGAFDEQVKENIDYNSDVPGFTGETNGTNGYVFDSWTPEVPAKVTGNLVFTATWKEMGTPTISHTPTDWTNQDVKVEITAPEEFVLLTIEYKIGENGTWTEYTGKFDVGENCTIYARLADGNNKGTEVNHEITNIDKVAPVASDIVVSLVEEDESKINLTATDNLSGIIEYSIRNKKYTEGTTTSCESTLSIDLEFGEIYENGTYELYLKDVAGNESKTDIVVNNIHYIVARIINAPDGYTDLIGKEYEKLELALADSDEAAQVGNVEIIIVHKISNESNEIKENRDYTIDLNDYAIESKTEDPVFDVKGKLTIIGNEEVTNTEEKGRIEGKEGVGIYISSTGEFTLGRDDEILPSVYSPVIKGKTYGIEKEIDNTAGKDPVTGFFPEGILNFYDGKIIGGTYAFRLQLVNDTPKLYDTTVITNAETNNQEATLAIVSGVEALIGKKRYLLLEKAIEEANDVVGDSNTQVEITIVRALTKPTIIIDNSKNIKLDLNGYTLSTTSNGYGIENYGRLEICDSSEKVDEETGELIPGTGKITSSSNSTILNGVINYDADSFETIDLSNAVANRDYYFEMSESGTLVSNNKGKNRSTAESYLEIDLTGKEGEYVFLVNSTISSYANNDWGFITVTDNTDPVSVDVENGRKVHVSGDISANDDVFYLSGGQKYYIHFGYYKYYGTTNTEDKFEINSLKYGKSKINFENIELNSAVPLQENSFIINEDGKLVSNSSDGFVSAYYEVDLKDKIGIYEVRMEYEAIGTREYSGILVSNINIEKDYYNDTEERKIQFYGKKDRSESIFNLAGGEKYYIFVYSQKKIANPFIIDSIKIGKLNKVGELTLTSGTCEMTKSGEYAVIENEALLYVNGGILRADQINTGAIVNGKNTCTGYISYNNGEIYTNTGSSSYGIKNLNNSVLYLKNIKGCVNSMIHNEAYAYLKNGTVENTWGSNANNYGVVNTKYGTLNTKDENFKMREYSTGILNLSSKYNTYNAVVIDGGIFSAGAKVSNSNRNSAGIRNGWDSYTVGGKMLIKNATIKEQQYGIINNRPRDIDIENVTINDVDENGIPTVYIGLYAEAISATVTVDNCEIYARDAAIKNSVNHTFIINNGELSVYNNQPVIQNNLSNNGGKIIINGGTITGTNNVIYCNGTSEETTQLTITGGTLESTNDNAIYSLRNSKITIGTNDDTISTTVPSIKGTKSAIDAQSSTINFYDGVLIGTPGKVVNGSIDEIPDNVDIVMEVKADGLEYDTLGNLTTYVAKIAQSSNPDVSQIDTKWYKLEDGYYYFKTLESAVDACNTTNETTVEVIDTVYLNRGVVVDENQNVKIKLNNNTIHLHSTIDFENNGTLKIENDTKYANMIGVSGQIFKNNEGAKLDVENILIDYKKDSAATDFKYIDNFGELNLNNVYYDIEYYLEGTSKPILNGYAIYNEDGGITNITNSTLYGNPAYWIYNKGKDKIDGENKTYAVTIENVEFTTIRTTTHTTYLIYNNEEGTVLIKNTAYNRNIYNDHIVNNSSGEIIIDNCTLNLTEIQNKASGKILIKGSATDVTASIINAVNGTVEIQDGYIHYGSNVITNNGTLNISGGEITNNGTSTGDRYGLGISNSSTGNTTITGGKVKSNIYYAINNAGTLVAGVEDGILEYTPIIYGKEVGVNNTGTMELYGGIIEGKTSNSIKGNEISKTEEGAMPVRQVGPVTINEGTANEYTVGEGREIITIQMVYVATVESTGDSYTSIKEAYSYCANTDKITIIHDAAIPGTEESIEIPVGKNITIDLNGYNVSVGNDNTFVNNGTLCIKDGTSHIDENNKIVEGSMTTSGHILVDNNGTLTINKGKYVIVTDGNSNVYNKIIKNNKTLVVEDGRFYSSLTNNIYYLYLIENASAESEATINNGTFSYIDGTKDGIRPIGNINSGIVNIYNGEFTASTTIFNKLDGTINIYNGTFTGVTSSNSYNIYSPSSGTGTINVSGGKIISAVGIRMEGLGTLNVTGGQFENTAYNIYNYNSGTINIDGTALTAETPIILDKAQISIVNYASGTVSVKGHVNITTKNNNNSAGILNAKTGIINIGDPDNITNDVKITSPYYGVIMFEFSSTYIIIRYENSELNYYGGEIKGKVEAIAGQINVTPAGYQTNKTMDEDGYETYKLIPNPTEVATNGTTKYDSLQEAFSSNSTGTIKLLKDLVFDTTETFEIGSGKDLTLDLNGHDIRLNHWTTLITNKGKLTITDSSLDDSGIIEGYSRNTIRNEGTLEIIGGHFSIKEMRNDKLVHNTENGTVKITGGDIFINGQDGDQNHYGIYSDNNNKIQITGGVFTTNTQAQNYKKIYLYLIYSTAPNTTIEITGGNFEGTCDNGAGNYYNRGNDYLAAAVGDNATINISGSVYSTVRYSVYTEKSAEINISGNVIFTYTNANIISGTYGLYMKGATGVNTVANIDLSSTGKMNQIYAENFQGENTSLTVNLNSGLITGYNTIAGKDADNTDNIILNMYEDASIDATSDGIRYFKTVNMHDGEITANGVGIRTKKNGNTSIEAGTITGKTAGIEINTNGEVSIKEGVEVTASNGPGIKINNGTLTLGTNEGGYPNITSPKITGTTYGLQNVSGTVNFYDGILKGNTNAIAGSITGVPELFSVIYSSGETIATLGIKATFEQIASVNGIYYDSLSTAVEAALEQNAKLVICKDITTNSSIVVPSGKELIIDLAGFSLNAYEDNAIIINNGTLTILDETNDDGLSGSKVKNYAGPAVENNGDLTIGINDGTIYTNAPGIIGKNVAIDNKGTLTIYDGRFGITDTGTVITTTGTLMIPQGYSLTTVGDFQVLVQN